jgi:hypothetical protein
VISNEVLLAIIGVVAAFASAWAYGYKKEQDRKTLALEQQIEEAKREASSTTSMLTLMQRMLNRMEQADEQTREERKAWIQVVEKNADAKNRLAESVDQNSDKVGEMQEQFAEFREAVGNKFEAFKQQLESSLSAEGLGPVLDVVFERFMKRVQGVVVHAPKLAEALGDDDTLQLPAIPASQTVEATREEDGDAHATPDSGG